MPPTKAFLPYSDIIDSPPNVTIVSSTLKRRRRLVFSLLSVLCLMCLSSILTLVRHSYDNGDVIEHVSLPPVNDSQPSGVRGPPTSKFRDNLLHNKKYITSWGAAGWTNDVMAFGNLIYLGLITGRIPIVPKFTPSHIGGDAVHLPFSEVFDVPRLSSLLGFPVIEWTDVKDQSSMEIEDLGCWSIWQSQQYYEESPRMTWFPQTMGLDLAYTQAPTWIKSFPGNVHNRMSAFWDLAKLSFPTARDAYLNSGVEINRTPSPIHDSTIDPDDHLLCMDYLYYVEANSGGDYEADYSPGWRFAVTHMHFTERLQSIANIYLRSIFGLEDDAPIPPFITIHMRHGDFGNWCQDIPKEDCFPSLPVINRRIQEVKDELAIKFPGMNVEHVIMTSDESDEAWWKEVTEFGWYAVDHSKTVELYGRWYPLIIDAVIQSMGMGFVGTYMSTFSTMGRRRVEDWQGGATRMVRWGHKGADDH